MSNDEEEENDRQEKKMKNFDPDAHNTPVAATSAVAAAATSAATETSASASASLNTDTDTDTDTYNDATIAQVYNAIEQLTSIFQFTQQQAQDAIEAVGPHDVTRAYNYILDNLGGEDKGGAIVPIDDCPHIKGHVLLNENEEGRSESLTTYNYVCGHDTTTTSRTGRMKMDLVGGGGEDGKCPSIENWLCLHCGVVRCSRYVNGHCQEHAERTGHCIAVSLGDLSVWCFQCSAYLHHDDALLAPILKKIESLKFQEM